MSTYKLETATLNARVNKPKSAVGLMWDRITKPVAEPPYRPLPDYHIRVLKVKPGTSQYPLRVKLKVVDPRKSKYTALSYVWDQRNDGGDKNANNQGPPSNEVLQTILCGGTSVSVTSNLYDALCQLRDIQTDVPVFVDALCINFEDNAERTNYLEIMGHVYARAASVIVWLGRKDPSSDETMLIMKRLVNAIDWRRMQGDANIYDFRDARFFQHIGMEPLTLKQWRQIHDFCQMKWFTRTWAFFELISAKSALFLWGDACMELDFLIDFGMILGLSGWLDKFRQNASDEPAVGLTKMLGPVSRLRTTPMWHPRNQEFNTWMKNEYGLNDEIQRAWKFFEILLESAEAFECADPRDKLFATLTFARMVYAGKPMNKQWPTPTYAKSAPRVLNEFCTLILQYTGQSSILVPQSEPLLQQRQRLSRPVSEVRTQSSLPPVPPPHQYLQQRLYQHQLQQLQQQAPVRQLASAQQPQQLQEPRGRPRSRYDPHVQ